MEPIFRYMKNGEPVVGWSKEAGKEKAIPKTGYAQPHIDVERKARETVIHLGGDVTNEKHVLGQHVLQIGQYRGRTFKWLLENDLGFAAWLIEGMKNEREDDNPLSKNKFAFRKYFIKFPECLTALKLRARFAKRDQDRVAGTPKLPQQLPQQQFDGSDDELVKEVSRVETALAAAAKQGPVATFRIQRPSVATTKTSSLSTLHGAVTQAATPLPDAVLEAIKVAATSAARGASKQGNPHFTTLKVSSVKAGGPSTIPPTAVRQGREKRQRLSTHDSKSQPSKASTTFQSSENSPVVKDQLGSAIVQPTTIQQTLVTEVTSCDTTQSVISLSPGFTDAEVLDSLSTYLSVPSTDELNEITEAISLPFDDDESADPLPSLSSVLRPAEQDYPIPDSWKSYVPKVDQRWISKAIFTVNDRGNPEIDLRKVDKLWWEPPQPQLIPTYQPRIDRYFGHRLLLWLPKKLWKVRLVCPYCESVELTSSGPYRLTRMVLDIDSFFILATEYLCCKTCRRFQIGWSKPVLDQLDPGHRSQFPVIVTRKSACAVRVIRLLRQRGLGNSPTLLRKKLLEQHDESRLTKTIQYLTDCSKFKKGTTSLHLVPEAIERPPAPIPIPTYHWLQFVYCLDVLHRLDEVKAAVTSVFGRVLKMDSTKKITKKLAGHAAFTAAWCTNVSNEHGQVLQSVMTATEGYGLEPMISGIVKRYQDAQVLPPEILYVDSQCCGNTVVSNTFKTAWSNLHVRLDIWHFMRRLAVGVTTDTHRLYGTFMSQLSRCIFQWDQTDLARLKEAKRGQMELSDINNPSDDDVIRAITKQELALHCRRATRGESETTHLLKSLIQMFDSDKGKDTMGVPLLHHDRIWEQWEKQKEHIVCIQDPPGIPLYTQTGSLTKGRVVLPVYRCARGSTSLESFHLHLTRFIPGTVTNATNFQAYLVEGMRRWNEDRGVAAVQDTEEPHYTVYNSALLYSANQLAQEVFAEPLMSHFKAPRKYTGEKIGIEYLFSQTSNSMSSEKEEDASEPNTTEETENTADEGFVDLGEDVDDLTIAEPVDVVAANVPVEVNAVPVEVNAVPVEVNAVSVEVNAVPVEVNAVPVEVNAVPVEVNAVPLEVNAVPVEVSAVPVEVSAVPVEVNAVPVEVNAVQQPQQAAHQIMLANRPSQTYLTPVEYATQSTTQPTTTFQPTTTTQPSSNAQPTTSTTVDGTAEFVAIPIPTPSTSSSNQESVGPDNIGGFQKVEALAEFLVSLLENKPRVITNEQAIQLISLWDAIEPYDKITKFHPRFKPFLVKGRFKQPKQKRLEMTPGVDSVKRCFMGSNCGPAQWPSCNRYVEAVTTKLCMTHRSPTKQKNQRSKCRWNIILRDYETIRTMVYNCQKVAKGTTIQMPHLSVHTIRQWYNTRDKQKDKTILEQGLTLHTHKTASEPLPLPLEKPTTINIGSVPSEFQFVIKPNTAGQSLKVRRRILPELAPASPVPILPKLSPSLPVPILPKPPVALAMTPVVATAVGTTVVPLTTCEIEHTLKRKLPYSTDRYKKQKIEKEAMGIFKRKYNKTAEYRRCGQCGKDVKSYGHVDYYKNIYCPEKSTQSVEEWKAPLKVKYARKKQQ